jgi:hypothetical protein
MYQNAPQPNMLQQFGQIQGIANAYEQNKILQQQQGLNVQELANMRSQNALIGANTERANVETARSRVGLSADQAELYSRQLGIVGQALATVYGVDGSRPTRGHVQDATTELVAQGVIPLDMAAHALRDLPSQAEVDDAAAQGKPSPVSGWLVGHMMNNEKTKQMLQPMLPNYQPRTVGGQTHLIDMNPISNPDLPFLHIVEGLSPEELSTPTTWVDPTTLKQMQGTREEYLRTFNGGRPYLGETPPGVYDARTGQTYQGPGVKLAPPQQQQAASGATAAPGQAAAAQPAQAAPQFSNYRTGPLGPGEAGGVQPGAVEAQSGVSQTGAGQVSALQKEYENAPTLRAIYNNMQSDLKQFTSGPGAEKIYKGTALWNEVVPKFLQGNTEAVAAYENFEKLAQQLAIAQMHSGGATGSDAQLMSSLAANPHGALSQYGVQRILAMLKGNLDVQQHKFELWNSTKSKYGGAAGYGDFLAENNHLFAPRAYQLQYLDAEHRAQLWQEMKGDERAQVDAAFKGARDKGWLGKGEGQGSMGGR